VKVSDKKSLFSGRSIGDLPLCVNGKVGTLYGRASFSGIRSMSGRHSEVGKEKLGPYLRGKDERCLRKRYTSPLNSPPNLKNQAGWPSG
jgi:hypothetical protein